MEREDEPRPADARDDEVRGLGDVPGGPRPVPAPPPADWPAEDDELDDDARSDRSKRDPSAIRAEDTEPYVGLQYVARLFKIVAMVVIVALTAEIVAALVMEGPNALLPLFLELLQGAVLWGASDLTLLFIDVGHDVRAARVLLGRMSARVGQGYDPVPPETPEEQRRKRQSGEEYIG